MSDKSKELHDLEQSCATMAENFPPMWYRLYLNCRKEGFSDDQAFKILITFIMSMTKGSVHL